jgi:hypothetical protein
MNELAARILFLVPNAIGQRLDAPPQKIPGRRCFWAILRKQIVQKDVVAVICLTWLVF